MATHDRVIASATPTVAAHPDIACRGEDPTVFYPGSRGTPHAAKAICGRCPHAEECLEWALATDQRFGIWAGKTPEQRLEIKRNREEA